MIKSTLIPNSPGIYCFKNKTNCKCYIGQAINLRKRFKAHMNSFKNKRIDNLLYKAFTKYTLENFEYIILETITLELSNQELKKSFR